ncbi:MAG: 2-hydroxychromene-2-carboxylate isomerase [Halioglobus sp.]
MSTQLDFYFDFGSPTTYLAYKRLQQLEQQYDLELVYKPMLLGGVFKATSNASPVTIPAKGQYMSEHDMPRFAQRYGVELAFNPFFPINTLYLMRGVFAARKLNCLPTYLDAVFQAMWVTKQNMGDLDVVAEVLHSAGLDAEALLAATQEPEIKQALIAATEEAVSRGAFGAPTMYIGDEMFFGQDRLDFVEERLRSA